MKRKIYINNNDLFASLCKKETGVECVKEYKFHPVRKWRFDYAFVEKKVAVEVDGGVWIGGRHNRPLGYKNDMEKFNAAATMGWLILKFTPDELYKNETFEMIKITLNIKKL